MVKTNNNIQLKILDNEIWLYKNKILYKEQTPKIMENNYIINNKELFNSLTKTITKYKLSNKLIQNKIYIIINKLYCETNLYIIKNIMYNLGLSNYKFIYEEDLYKDLYINIISIWNTNGIIITNNVEKLIDINNKNEIKKIKNNYLLITSNKDIIKQFNKEIILFENTNNPIFEMLENT